MRWWWGYACRQCIQPHWKSPRGLSINTSLFQCGIREMHQAFSPNHLFLRCQRPAATFQSSDLLSIILNKDANGSPSWWRTSLPPDLLNTPTLVCLPHHNIPLLLSNSPDSRKQRLEGFCATSGTSSLLLKGAIEEVPQSDLKQGFFIRYFLVPKKGGGLQPILDLCRLNLSLYKGKFKMLTLKTYVPDSSGRLVCHCRPEGCLFSRSGRLTA